MDNQEFLQNSFAELQKLVELKEKLDQEITQSDQKREMLVEVSTNLVVKEQLENLREEQEKKRGELQQKIDTYKQKKIEKEDKIGESYRKFRDHIKNDQPVTIPQNLSNEQIKAAQKELKTAQEKLEDAQSEVIKDMSDKQGSKEVSKALQNVIKARKVHSAKQQAVQELEQKYSTLKKEKKEEAEAVKAGLKDAKKELREAQKKLKKAQEELSRAVRAAGPELQAVLQGTDPKTVKDAKALVEARKQNLINYIQEQQKTKIRELDEDNLSGYHYLQKLQEEIQKLQKEQEELSQAIQLLQKSLAPELEEIVKEIGQKEEKRRDLIQQIAEKRSSPAFNALLERCSINENLISMESLKYFVNNPDELESVIRFYNLTSRAEDAPKLTIPAGIQEAKVVDESVFVPLLKIYEKSDSPSVQWGDGEVSFGVDALLAASIGLASKRGTKQKGMIHALADLKIYNQEKFRKLIQKGNIYNISWDDNRLKSYVEDEARKIAASKKGPQVQETRGSTLATLDSNALPDGSNTSQGEASAESKPSSEVQTSSLGTNPIDDLELKFKGAVDNHETKIENRDRNKGIIAVLFDMIREIFGHATPEHKNKMLQSIGSTLSDYKANRINFEGVESSIIGAMNNQIPELTEEEQRCIKVQNLLEKYIALEKMSADANSGQKSAYKKQLKELRSEIGKLIESSFERTLFNVGKFENLRIRYNGRCEANKKIREEYAKINKQSKLNALKTCASGDAGLPTTFSLLDLKSDDRSLTH